jgi:effector-binding domain-containing protein
MAGDMDIEYGIPVATALSGDERVKADMLPAGRYASLIYIGHGLTGNKTLIEWAKANCLAWDRWDDPKGDAFRSRYESYLTDPKIEPRKTKWEVEVAIKLKDD